MIIIGGWAALHFAPSAPTHIADSNDVNTVMRGKQIYAGHCGACHGRYLQGRALWQLADHYAGRRAPAHDESGHTWQHPDEDLFEMTKYGRFASAPSGYSSYMPAFAHDLSDRDVLAVLAYIKALAARASRRATTAQPRLCGNAAQSRESGLEISSCLQGCAARPPIGCAHTKVDAAGTSNSMNVRLTRQKY